MIETEVEGDPGAVRTAATWVGETLKGQVVDAGRDATDARRRASTSWEGEASQAYRAFAGKVVEAGDEQEHDLDKVAEKLRTYAVKLTHIQDRMRDRRSEAGGGGLTVSGTVIQEPPEPVRPADLPAGSSPTQADAWDRDNAAFERANDKVALYNRLATEVEDDITRLEEWIEANLTAIATVEDPPLSSYLMKQLKKAPALVMMFGTDLHGRQLRADAAAAQQRAAELRRQADEARADRRSGNPARRAAGHGVNIPESRRTARGLDAVAEGAERLGRRVPVIGTVLSLGLAGNDIANGESPGQTVASEAAGMAGGALGAAAVVGGAALLGATAPVWGVAVGAAALGVGAGMLAEYAWDHWVPEDVTEAIDEGLEDFGEGVADTAGDIKDAAGDALDSITPW